MSDSEESHLSPRANVDCQPARGSSGGPGPIRNADLSNVEAHQLFAYKLDSALAENKKTILQELDSRTASTLPDKNLDFKLAHHKERFLFLSELQSNFESIHKFVERGEFSGIEKLITDSVSKIKEQKKVIRIADKYGWDVAREYKDDPITDNSEDNQRLRQAEQRAKRKRFDNSNYNNYNNPFRSYRSKFQPSRFSPYQRNFNSIGAQPSLFKVQPDQCLYCNAFGHWSVNCPLKRRTQGISKPTATQTTPSATSDRL
ncbi:uncharacterized protein LOC134242979 [Saccostrea cucullata]|uniref:uncharacterized protein LOC134242979 n=1 Tax=Saccostrea cuccullata TaxID=36930 RepID=UPI002ED08609